MPARAEVDALPVLSSQKAECKEPTPQVIEICCGSAGLCAAFWRIGIPALGIDWGMNRHVQKSPWLSINMAEASGLEQAIDILEGCTALNLVWIGAPCGTASRAREVVRGPDMPPQLRSAKHPEGLPGLGETDMKKVQAANMIYKNTLEIINWCESRNVTWCVENPANSYLWYLAELRELVVPQGQGHLVQRLHGRRQARQKAKIKDQQPTSARCAQRAALRPQSPA